jgi:hypothetical protein
MWKRNFLECAKDRGLIPRNPRVSLENFTAKGYLLILIVESRSDGLRSPATLQSQFPAAISKSGHRPPCLPWPPRRRTSATQKPTTTHPPTNSNRWRSSTRSHLPENKLSTVTVRYPRQQGGGGSMADPTANANTSIHLTKTPIESVESKRRRK